MRKRHTEQLREERPFQEHRRAGDRVVDAGHEGDEAKLAHYSIFFMSP